MKKSKYIKDVLRSIDASGKIKKRIEEDLTLRIDELEENDPFFNVIEELGEPDEVAKEFMENLNIQEKHFVEIGFSTNTKPFEYKSKKSLFGLPLVHINTGGRYTNKVAKGIIAIGDVAYGVVSIGGVSLGLVALGGIGIGAVGLGGIGIGLLGLGGVAVGLEAYGGVAFGLIEAFGAFARSFNN